jgi:hypothetical protein
MKIEGIAGLSPDQIQREVERGGKFVIYQWCVSALVITFKRSSPVYFLRPGESAVGKSLPWTLLSLSVGWWGFPWGLIYTPMVLYNNLRGGKDVTTAMMPYLYQAQAASGQTAAQPQPGTWPPPPNVNTW